MQQKHHLVWESWLAKQHRSLSREIDFFTHLFCGLDVKITARMSYGAPFLYRYGPLGYFGVDKKHGLYFGFYWGKLLKDTPGADLFYADERKMVKLVFLEGKMHNEEFLGNLLLLLDIALKIDQEKYDK